MRERYQPEGKCACSGDNLDRFVQPVALAILSHGPETGYAIIKKMPEYATFTGAGPDPTGVYRTLRGLKDRGLIEQPELADSREAAPYKITEDGRLCLNSWVDTLETYAAQISALAKQIQEQ